MKKLLILTIVLLLLSGCITPYIVKENTEYVLLNELNLTGRERFKLHWSTYSDSPFAVFDSRSGKYFYKKDYDYSFLNSKKHE